MNAVTNSENKSMERSLSLQLVPVYAARQALDLCSVDGILPIGRSLQQKPATLFSSNEETKAQINSFRTTSSDHSLSQPNCSSEAGNMQYQPKACSMRLLIQNDSALPLSDLHESMDAKNVFSSSSIEKRIENSRSQKKKPNRIRSLSYVHITPEESEDLRSSRLATGSMPMTLVESQLMQPLGFTNHRRAASQSTACAARQPHMERMISKSCQKIKIQGEMVDQAASGAASNGYGDGSQSPRLCNFCLHSSSCSASQSGSSSNSISSRCGRARGRGTGRASGHSEHRSSFRNLRKALMSCKFC